MEKIMVLIILGALSFMSCNSSKKQDSASLAKTVTKKNSTRYNGKFKGEVLDKRHKKNLATITLKSDTNSYTFDNNDSQQSGTFSWASESGNVIELKGLAEEYPNKFLVTSGAIIQMMNGSTLQDVEGNRQFVLSIQ